MFYLLATTVISFILITMVRLSNNEWKNLLSLTSFQHLIAGLIRAFGAFTGNMDIPGFPDKYYAKHTALSMLKTASYVSVSMVADTLLVN